MWFTFICHIINEKRKKKISCIFLAIVTLGIFELYYFLGQYNSISGEDKKMLGNNLSAKYPLPCLILQKKKKKMQLMSPEDHTF